MKMALNVLSAPALWTGYTLILLIIVDGTKGGGIPDMIVGDTKGASMLDVLVGDTKGPSILEIIKNLLGSIDNRFKTIEDFVNETSITVGIIENKVDAINEKVKPIDEIKKVVDATSIKVSNIEKNVDAISNTVNSIDGIVDRCPSSDGYFVAPGTGGNQCLKVITEKIAWGAAVTMCIDEGIKQGLNVELARPYNVLALRQYLFEEFNYWDFWVNACGNGSQILWETERPGPVGPNNPLWMKNQPGSNVGDAFCMVMAASPKDIKAQPDQVYFTQSCKDYQYAICQLSPNKTSISFN